MVETGVTNVIRERNKTWITGQVQDIKPTE